MTHTQQICLDTFTHEKLNSRPHVLGITKLPYSVWQAVTDSGKTHPGAR